MAQDRPTRAQPEAEAAEAGNARLIGQTMSQRRPEVPETNDIGVGNMVMSPKAGGEFYPRGQQQQAEDEAASRAAKPGNTLNYIQSRGIDSDVARAVTGMRNKVSFDDPNSSSDDLSRGLAVENALTRMQEQGWLPDSEKVAFAKAKEAVEETLSRRENYTDNDVRMLAAIALKIDKDRSR